MISKILNYLFGPAYRWVPDDHDPSTDHDYTPNKPKVGCLLAAGLAVVAAIVFGGNAYFQIKRVYASPPPTATSLPTLTATVTATATRTETPTLSASPTISVEIPTATLTATATITPTDVEIWNASPMATPSRRL